MFYYKFSATQNRMWFDHSDNLSHSLILFNKPGGPPLSSFSDFVESFERKYCPFGLALCINGASILFVGML